MKATRKRKKRLKLKNKRTIIVRGGNYEPTSI